MRSKVKKPGAFRTDSNANQEDRFSFLESSLVPAAALFLLTLLLYWPSFRAGYIWDDDIMVEKNTLVNGGWPGLRDIWTTKKYPDFVPLTATAFWVEAQLGGARPTVQHTTNIFLQACNVVLVWLVLRRLRIPGPWLAAAVFAAHPLCVTSVTWIAERKNTLSMLFYLLSFLFYLRSTVPSNAREETLERGCVGVGDQPQRVGMAGSVVVGEGAAAGLRHSRAPEYWLSFFFFILALLSKTATVVLPVVFLLCAWWRSGKISRADVLPTLPFFGVAFAGGVATLIVHYFFGDARIQYDDWLTRVLGGAKAFWFYFCKAFVPVNFTMHYPRWEMDAKSVTSYLPLLAMAAIFAVCWRFRRSWGRTCLFGLGYFFLALAPALGIAKMTFLKFSQVADHFQFFALPGLIALVVGGAFHLAKGKRASHFCTVVLIAVAVPTLAVLSWKHQRIFGDAETLWLDNIKKNPKSWLAHYGMTSILQARGQLKEVELHYRQAIEIRPDYLDALSNLAGLLAQQERWQEAVELYRRALSFDPAVAMIHFNLGTAFMKQGRYIDAVGPLTKAVELNPRQSNFHNNLASVLLKTGRQDEAFHHAREAIRLNPENDEAQANLGLMFFQIGKADEAIAQFQSALRFDSGNLAARYRLGTVLAAAGRNDEALENLLLVVQEQPGNVQAHTGIVEILKRQGEKQKANAHEAALSFLRGRELVNQRRIEEAKESIRQALRLDGSGTVALAEQVCTLETPNGFAHLDLLASICTEEQQVENAMNVLQRIVALAEASGRKEVAVKYRGYLEDYRRTKGR